MRLAHEADDLAEAVEDVLKPVHDTVARMRWNGPHHDRVRAELGTMTQATGTVASRLRERAEVFRRAADVSRSGVERLPEGILEGLLGPAGGLLHDRYLR
ncbi:hypothetical protein AB0B89_01500 [Sphaerisporangium sp. NPDC049002]|uniref:hypothetical protein n=1 Tax=Sphaerisporangium sp. NPDC049002 TaxID=3155392 RepID=UPI0033DCA8AD